MPEPPDPGTRLPRYIAATISGDGCGHGRGWTDITGSSVRPASGEGDKGKEAAA